MSHTAHFTGGPDDPCSCKVAVVRGGLPRELRFPSFRFGRALIRTERVYERVGPEVDRHATYRFRREVIVHAG